MKRTLYLGVDPSHFSAQGHLIHYPVIKIVPRPLCAEMRRVFANLHLYTHLIFTSKHAVQLFFQHAECSQLSGALSIAVGRITALHLQRMGVHAPILAQEQTQEGIVQLLLQLDLAGAHLLLPRSARSRPVLTRCLQDRGVRYDVCELYDTQPQKPTPVPNLDRIDEIVFTSPSTVDAFFRIYDHLPAHVRPLAVGPVTQQALTNASARIRSGHKSPTPVVTHKHFVHSSSG